jgi:phosphoglycolate phosphatase-like HAD superfamily hydrolase
VALDKVGGGSALVVGDSVWDGEAAERAGLPSILLRCGGVPEADLVRAGAAAVLADPRALLADLDRLLVVS